ncbi:uncharacterized protein LOC144916730 [Branchiostoma floridae x Branchiostoma belcheri]
MTWIRLAACWKKVQKSIKYNVERLKNPETKQEFRLTLANRFDALRYDSNNDKEENEDDIEAEWSTIKEAFTSTCADVLGKIKREKKEWMTQETWDRVEERRILKADIDNSRTRNQKAKAMKAYNAADRRVKRSCRKDKRKWFSNIAAEAEVAASKQDMKTLYKITKTLSVKQRQVNKPVQDKEDYEKAFDSVDRNTLWNILSHYGIPPKIINMIKVFYSDFQAQVFHEGDPTESFSMTTGISYSIGQMRGKMKKLEDNPGRVRLIVNATKTKEMRVKTVGNAKPVSCRGVELEIVKDFTYLGSVISSSGGAEMDIEARTGEAKAAFAQLKPVWKARNISLKTKLRIFESNVKSILLYGCETWGLTQANIKKLQTFINARLRYILGMWWPRKVSNQDLLEIAGQERVEMTIRRRTRKTGRPQLSWKRGVRKDLTAANTSWHEVKTISGDRGRWRAFTEALCSRTGEED